MASAVTLNRGRTIVLQLSREEAASLKDRLSIPGFDESKNLSVVEALDGVFSENRSGQQVLSNGMPPHDDGVDVSKDGAC